MFCVSLCMHVVVYVCDLLNGVIVSSFACAFVSLFLCFCMSVSLCVCVSLFLSVLVSVFH